MLLMRRVPLPALVLLMLLNVVVLLGQVWPAGAPPFARTVNIAFLAANLVALGVIARVGRSGT